MKRINPLIFLCLGLILSISSCEDDQFENDNADPSTVTLVTSSVRGVITNENDEPLSGVLVKIGTVEVETDVNGIFRVQDRKFDQNGTVISASRLGYYEGIKIFNPSEGKESFVALQLLIKQKVGAFLASSGGVVSTDDGVSIEFEKNSIVLEDNTTYDGEVTVFAKWIDPTGDLLYEQMPGNLGGIDAEGNPVQLATYGMVAVELESSTGSSLQLIDGESAILTMPVPSEILGLAPPTIPLWSMDETTGNWVEESTATLQGDKYVGEVSHFSFWNCDAPFPLIELEGKIIDSEGNPLVWTKITIYNDAVGVGSAYSNENGVFKGYVPANLALTLLVHSQCLEPIYETVIGPFSSDVVVEPIIFPTSLFFYFNNGIS